MTENEIHARLQHMVGSSDGSVLPNLSTSPNNSKVLKKGEQVYYADLRQWKTGDGATTIANLPFDKGIPSEHNHDLDYVTIATYQTITGKKTMSGGMAFTNSLPVNNSMKYFLGIDAFSQGGTVKYADASKMCGMIGAMPVLSAASGISVTNNVMTILPETEGNFYHVYSVPAVTLFTIKIVGLNMAPGYNLRLVLKGSNTGTDIIFTRPSNDGPNNIHCPYPAAGVASNRVTVLDMCVYDGTSYKEMVVLKSAELATI